MSIEITVPVLPESVADAVLLEWKKQVGDQVGRDEILVEVETDKVVLEVAAPEDGVLGEILREAGATVTAGEVLARFEPGAAAQPEAGGANEAPATAPPPAPAPANAGETGADEIIADTGADPDAGDDDQPISPAVRRLVAEHGLNPADIKGSGPGGRATKEDILEFIGDQVAPDVTPPPETPTPPHSPEPPAPTPLPQVTTPAPATTPAAGAREDARRATRQETRQESRQQTREPMSRLRRTIAVRLVEAQQSAALLTTFNEVNMRPVMDLRARGGEEFEKAHGVRLGLMSFFVKASVTALQKFPLVNAYIDGDDIVRHNYNDIGIAVASERGLVVPVLRNCESLGFAAIETRIREFGERARDGKIDLEDLSGGTFTITNGGVFGSLLSTPIVNPPQSAILGMHKIQERPVADNGQVVIRPMMYLALTYDHRIIDGREAVGFLVAIKEMLEDPARMLLRL